jgi:hypothetical protein
LRLVGKKRFVSNHFPHRRVHARASRHSRTAEPLTDNVKSFAPHRWHGCHFAFGFTRLLGALIVASSKREMFSDFANTRLIIAVTHDRRDPRIRFVLLFERVVAERGADRDVIVAYEI